MLKHNLVKYYLCIYGIYRSKIELNVSVVYIFEEVMSRLVI